MRIAHLITSLSCGGAEKQLLALCTKLQDEHSVQVGVLKDGGELFNHFQEGGIQVHEFHHRDAWDITVILAIRKWLRSFRPDIIHTHLFKADVYGGFAAASLKVPQLCTKWNEDQYLKNPFVALLGRMASKHTFRIIAVSEAVRSFLVKEAGFNTGDITVIYPGIEQNVSAKRATSQFLRFGIVARLAPQKGHTILLKAFAQALKENPGMRLLIFGSGPLEEDLRIQARDLNLCDATTFFGSVLNTDEIYSQIDVLLLPSLWEGAPIVLLESMIRGIPPIATTVGGVPEIVTSDCGILIPPNNAEALTNSILQIAGNRYRLEEFSNHCLKRVSQFSLNSTVESHIELYQKALHEKR